MLMSVVWLDHGVTVSVQRAVGCAVPQGAIGLGLQGRAHGGDGIGGVGRRVQQDVGGGGGLAESCIGLHVGR